MFTTKGAIVGKATERFECQKKKNILMLQKRKDRQLKRDTVIKRIHKTV